MSNEAIPLNYIPIVAFIVIALGFGVVSLLAGWVVRPNRPYRAKLTPYESGSPLFSDARVQFPMRYYIIAMLFVIFDIEVIFCFHGPLRFANWAWWGCWKWRCLSASSWSGYGTPGRRGRWNGTERRRANGV